MNPGGIPQTKAERTAFFDQLFDGIEPAEKKPMSLIAALKPYRAQLIAKRRAGYSFRQIAERLKASRLAIDASPSTLKVVIAGPAAKRRAKMKKLAAKRAAILAAAKTAAGPRPAAPGT